MAIDGWVLIGVAVAMAMMASPLSPAAPWSDECRDRRREADGRRKAANGRSQPDAVRDAGRRPFRERPVREARISRPPERPGRPADPE